MTEQIKPMLAELKSSFAEGLTRGYQWRIEQLNLLMKGIQDMKGDLEAGMLTDLGRCKQFTRMAEIAPTLEYLQHHIDHLHHYMKDVHADPPVIFSPCTSFVRYEPLGVALIMGSWNFPYFVTLKPLISAISAGNCAMLKPSELSPATAACMQVLVEKYLDTRCIKVIQGEADVSIALTKQRFDIICFTGSTEKGKLVAQAAAKNLVPCILELGGKCPFIVDETADLDYAAMKCMYGKFQNAGQTCIGVDHVFVREDMQEKFMKHLLVQLKRQYKVSPGDHESQSQINDEVGRVVNDLAFDRIEELIRTSGGTTIVGGLNYMKKHAKYISPTIIKNPSMTSKLMTEEIFGPVLPIVTYKSIDDVIKRINGGEKPLAIYFAGKSTTKNFQRLQNETSSGNISTNDVLHHTLDVELGFGGVGHSGQGRVGGYESFKQWSNAKSIVTKQQLNVWPYNYVCPPYTRGKVKIINTLLNLVSLKQNALFGGIFKIVVAFVGYMIIFGKWGKSKFRTELVQWLIDYLERHYVK